MAALWLTSCLVFILLTEANAQRDRSCTSSRQCGRGHCCMERIMIASKRQFDNGDTMPGSKICQPILTKDQPCGIFFSPCGCAPGLRCVARTSAAPMPVENQRMIIGPGGSQSVCVPINKY